MAVASAVAWAALRRARSAVVSARAFATSARPTAPPPPPPGVAFAFDIDGVLLRGEAPIPGAADAVRRLCDPTTGTPVAPFVFITNGGGVTEDAKAADLRRALGLPDASVRAEQVLLAHTPFRRLKTADPVLVIGGKDSLAVARSYGFAAAASPAQVAAAAGPATLPLRPPHDPAAVGRLPTHPVTGAPAGSPAWPFASVLVMYDPDCWYTAVQVTVDVVAGRGVAGWWRPGTARAAAAPPIPVHWSNGDVVWAGAHPAPRLGQGAFAAALRAAAAAAGHGDALAAAERVYGKPTAAPYELADAALAGQAARLASSLPRGAGAAWARAGVRAVVAVGDNPAADAAGAAAVGDPWIPVLVRTGVHAGPGNCPVNPAAVVVEDVAAAVEWGCRLGADKAREWGAVQ